MLYQMWTGIMLVIWFALFFQIKRFRNKYPEFFQSDEFPTGNRSKAYFNRLLEKKQELIEQYNGRVKLLIAIIPVWLLGMFAIYKWYTPETKGIFITAICILSFLYVLTILQSED